MGRPFTGGTVPKDIKRAERQMAEARKEHEIARREFAKLDERLKAHDQIVNNLQAKIDGYETRRAELIRARSEAQAMVYDALRKFSSAWGDHERALEKLR